MSATDMSRWLRLFVTGGKLDGKQVVPAEVVRKLLERPADTEYAMGWMITKQPTMARHTGATAAFSSAMAVVPERDFGVFVLVNVNSWTALAPKNVLDGITASILGTEKQAVTNIEFIARLLFGLIVGLIVFTFFFELLRWMSAKFPLALSSKERLMFGMTLLVNVVVVLAVTQYFGTPIATILATQPDLGIGFLITIGLGTIRQLLTGFNKTRIQRAIMEGE
jgi:hypothetical protein